MQDPAEEAAEALGVELKKLAASVTPPPVPPFRRWRAFVLDQLRKGRALEKIAQRAPFAGLPFEVRAMWPALDWAVWNEEIGAFSARVRQVAAVLGPPKSVTTESYAVGGEEAPDLSAEWFVEGVSFWPFAPGLRVTVRSLRPRGCKIDPRTSFQPEQRVELHPECKAVLRELEDAGG